MNLKEAYSYAVTFLERNNVDEADFKALCIVCSILNIKNSEYEMHKNDFVSMKKLADMLWKVKDGTPLQYVIGKWDFYESEFYVGEGVLIPRPETEELVQKTIDYISPLGKCIVYDLCSGSGCIGISIAKKCSNSFVYLIEKSKYALVYLEKNAKDIKNVKVINGDITDINSFKSLETADVIISNPPYIKSEDMLNLQTEVKKEPSMALDGGKDGLDFYRIINDNWNDKLKEHGKLFLEIGEEQGNSIKSVLSDFTDINIYKDIYGNDRMVEADKK